MKSTTIVGEYFCSDLLCWLQYIDVNTGSLQKRQCFDEKGWACLRQQLWRNTVWFCEATHVYKSYLRWWAAWAWANNKRQNHTQVTWYNRYSERRRGWYKCVEGNPLKAEKPGCGERRLRRESAKGMKTNRFSVFATICLATKSAYSGSSSRILTAVNCRD